MPIGRKRSHRLTGELLVARFASEGEQPIAPCGCKYGGNHHDSILFLPALPGGITVVFGRTRSAAERIGCNTLFGGRPQDSPGAAMLTAQCPDMKERLHGKGMSAIKGIDCNR
jgi:hypothetical protein